MYESKPTKMNEFLNDLTQYDLLSIFYIVMFASSKKRRRKIISSSWEHAKAGPSLFEMGLGEFKNIRTFGEIPDQNKNNGESKEKRASPLDGFFSNTQKEKGDKESKTYSEEIGVEWHSFETLWENPLERPDGFYWVENTVQAFPLKSNWCDSNKASSLEDPKCVRVWFSDETNPRYTMSSMIKFLFNIYKRSKVIWIVSSKSTQHSVRSVVGETLFHKIYVDRIPYQSHELYISIVISPTKETLSVLKNTGSLYRPRRTILLLRSYHPGCIPQCEHPEISMMEFIHALRGPQFSLKSWENQFFNREALWTRFKKYVHPTPMPSRSHHDILKHTTRHWFTYTEDEQKAIQQWTNQTLEPIEGSIHLQEYMYERMGLLSHVFKFMEESMFRTLFPNGVHLATHARKLLEQICTLHCNILVSTDRIKNQLARIFKTIDIWSSESDIPPVVLNQTEFVVLGWCPRSSLLEYGLQFGAGNNQNYSPSCPKTHIIYPYSFKETHLDIEQIFKMRTRFLQDYLWWGLHKDFCTWISGGRLLFPNSLRTGEDIVHVDTKRGERSLRWGLAIIDAWKSVCSKKLISLKSIKYNGKGGESK